MSNLVVKYIAFNKITVIIGVYFLLSAILKATTDIDFCIPCLWKTIFGFHCPGCGLTTAFISLMKLDYREAFEKNWLIFIILPIWLYYLAQDYVKHNRKYKA